MARYRNIGKREAAQWLLGEESPLPSVTAPKPKKPKAPPDYGTFEREHIYPGGQVKKFFYRLKDGSKRALWYRMDGGRWIMGKGDAPHILYEQGEPCGGVYIVEGEKDAENLSRLMSRYVVSGENSAGPGKWKAEYTERLKAVGVTWVAIISDNDEPGKAYAEETAAALSGIAEYLKVLDLRRVWPECPEHGDASDMIAAFGDEKTRELLDALLTETPQWTPPEPEEAAAPIEDEAQTIEDESRTTRRMNERIEVLRAAVDEAEAAKANGANAGDILKMLNQRTRVLKPLLTQAELEKILSEKLEVRYNVIMRRSRKC